MGGRPFFFPLSSGLQTASHPKFKVDEAALPIGAALHVAMALESLAGGTVSV